MIAIDYGTKRVGIAVSDEMQIIATALQTVSTSEFQTFIANYIQKEKVVEIIVGDPKKLDGSDNKLKTEILKWINDFQVKYPNIEVVLYDERFTSKIAFQSMITSGYNKTARRDKATIDKISATILLQDYMQSKK